MDVKDLKVFEAVARCQGINRAAGELNTVQSNVTGRVRLLEAELGVALFERRPSGMKLTAAGERLLPYALEVRAAINNAKRALTDVGAPSGQLMIGMRRSTSAVHLTGLLESYLAAYPAMDVRIRTEPSPLLTELVLQHRLDGAFVCNPIEHRDLVGETIFNEELVVLAPDHIPSLEAIGRDTRLVVLGEGSLYHRQLEAMLRRRGIDGLRVIELGTLENIVGCVRAGLGITLLPHAIMSALPMHRVCAHRVSDEDCRVQTIFIRRRDGFVSSALSAFLSIARAHAKGSKVVEIPRLSRSRMRG
jgi:DNA-binding transcriptional LysR family regulator